MPESFGNSARLSTEHVKYARKVNKILMIYNAYLVLSLVGFWIPELPNRCKLTLQIIVTILTQVYKTCNLTLTVTQPPNMWHTNVTVWSKFWSSHRRKDRQKMSDAYRSDIHGTSGLKN